MNLFFNALFGGIAAALLLLLLWRLAQRIGLALPRAWPTKQRLLCVRPLDFDA